MHTNIVTYKCANIIIKFMRKLFKIFVIRKYPFKDIISENSFFVVINDDNGTVKFVK